MLIVIFVGYVAIKFIMGMVIFTVVEKAYSALL